MIDEIADTIEHLNRLLVKAGGDPLEGMVLTTKTAIALVNDPNRTDYISFGGFDSMRGRIQGVPFTVIRDYRT